MLLKKKKSWGYVPDRGECKLNPGLTSRPQKMLLFYYWDSWPHLNAHCGLDNNCMNTNFPDFCHFCLYRGNILDLRKYKGFKK